MTSGILKNPGLKLLALVIAVALWVLVAGEEESVRVFSVPVDFSGLSRDRILSGETPESVQVRVKGSESILRRLASSDLSLPLDLGTLPTGHRSVQVLAPGRVRGVPSGAAVDSITPSRLNVLIERKISRTVGVAPSFDGSPPPGYRVLESRADPEEVTIEGPESVVSRLTVISTEPVSLHDKRESFVTLVSPSLGSPRVSVARPRPIKVDVRIEKEPAP